MIKRIDTISKRIRTLRSFINEEERTSRLYAQLGYPRQAHNEAEHSQFFRREIKRLSKLI